MLNYRISKNCTTVKDYSVNELEKQFFNELFSELSEQENRCIHLIRMTNGVLSVQYGTYPIGKIKLQGRSHWMQILKGQSSKTIEGTIADFIANIPHWKKYIKTL